ncbi:unnamed protein product [Lampetra fluviatilis]
MGGVRLEIFRMMLYLSFPVAMFWVSNQAEYFEEYVVKRKARDPQTKKHTNTSGKTTSRIRPATCPPARSTKYSRRTSPSRYDALRLFTRRRRAAHRTCRAASRDRQELERFKKFIQMEQAKKHE